jgi:hypothetical protein
MHAMMPDAFVLLAGFALAHAAWSVSDIPAGELLVSLAVVEKNGGRQPELDAWAFVREGVLSRGTGKEDVLSVDAWAKGMRQPITFVQEFRPYSSGAFRVRGDAMVIVEGRALEGAEAARLVEKLYEGVRQHPKAGQLWQGWHVK